MMKRTFDPLVSIGASDRLHYATGELLGADDFRVEQTYHRRQLARALLHLHGSGVVAGLRVTHRHRPGQNGVPDEVSLEVAPGLAVDHAGRVVEVPRNACLRLRRWFTFFAGQDPQGDLPDAGDLRAAWRASGGGPAGVIVADVFLAFHECPRGYTPAFASGPFDALDASQPSRVRDAYELSLVLRPEADADLPSAADPWDAISGGTQAERRASAVALADTMWRAAAEPAAENPASVDPTAVLLARLRIPAVLGADADAAPSPDWSAAAWTDEQGHLDHDVRRVLLPAAALARVMTP
jgi:hypothetical protein